MVQPVELYVRLEIMWIWRFPQSTLFSMFFSWLLKDLAMSTGAVKHMRFQMSRVQLIVTHFLCFIRFGSRIWSSLLYSYRIKRCAEIWVWTMELLMIREETKYPAVDFFPFHIVNFAPSLEFVWCILRTCKRRRGQEFLWKRRQVVGSCGRHLSHHPRPHLFLHVCNMHHTCARPPLCWVIL